jgi:hypothetical protein
MTQHYRARFREALPMVMGVASALAGLAGILRLARPATITVGDGVTSCGSVLRHSYPPSEAASCSAQFPGAWIAVASLFGAAVVLALVAGLLAWRRARAGPADAVDRVAQAGGEWGG